MMTNEENKLLNKAIFDYQREMFDKGGFYQSEMAQYLMQLSFERCAQWKDEQFTKQKQALIDKACEWLGKNAFNFDYINVNGEIMKYFFEDFRKAMEEMK